MRLDNNQFNLEKLFDSKQRNTIFICKRDELHKILKSSIKKLKFDTNTFHLATYYLDITLLNNPDIKIDLAAITCLYIAAKFFEINPYYEYFNDYRNFNKVFPYSGSEMRQLEIQLVKFLNYNLKIYTPYDYLKLFFSYGILFSDDSFLPDSQDKILNNNMNDALNLQTPQVIDEIYQLCEQILMLVLEGKLIFDYLRCVLFKILTN